MITQLHIRNFRLFGSLDIDGLKRVNLFAGKNNTGKTYLLEAIRIWAANGDSTVLNHLLQERGEFTPGWQESYENLFNRAALALQAPGASLKIQINDLTLERRHSTIEGVSYQGETGPDPKYPFPLDINKVPNFPKDQAVFIPFGNNQRFPLTQLWDKVVLTPLEDHVMDIVRETVLPDLVRLDVNKERTLVRVGREVKPFPLKSLGDGVERMLMLALGLVNAQNGYLLIDEIEAGLHHSILEIFWDKLFYYAQKFNVQVFASTHSHDTLKTFSYVLEKPGNEHAGAFFRLQQMRKTNEVEAVLYDLESLEFSLEKNLEPR